MSGQVSRGSAAHTVAGILGGGVPERRPLDASMPQQRMLDKALSPEKSQAYNQAFDSYSSSYRSKLDLMQHVHKVCFDMTCTPGFTLASDFRFASHWQPHRLTTACMGSRIGSRARGMTGSSSCSCLTISGRGRGSLPPLLLWRWLLTCPLSLCGRGSSKFCFSGGSRQSRRHLVDLQSENGTLNVLGARGDPRRR